MCNKEVLEVIERGLQDLLIEDIKKRLNIAPYDTAEKRAVKCILPIEKVERGCL